MAAVTALEEKLGEVIGLAEAAQEAVAKVISLPESDSQSDLVTPTVGELVDWALPLAAAEDPDAG
jgi:hypothetical protein